MTPPPPDGPSPDRLIPDPAFADDTGAADPDLAAALASYAAEPARSAEVLDVLGRARLLVPVVAVLGEMEHDAAGLAPGKSSDKSSDMAAVLLQGDDGRMALLAFTGTESLTRWNPDARPVPVTAQLAARAAIQEEASALVIDLAGPTTFVVEGEDLRGLASGWSLARVAGRAAWIRPAPG